MKPTNYFFVVHTLCSLYHWNILPLLQTLSDWMSSALSKRHQQESTNQQPSNGRPLTLVPSLSHPLPPASQKRSKTIQRMKSKEDVGHGSGSGCLSSQSSVTPLTAGKWGVFSFCIDPVRLFCDIKIWWQTWRFGDKLEVSEVLASFREPVMRLSEVLTPHSAFHCLASCASLLTLRVNWHPVIGYCISSKN